MTGEPFIPCVGAVVLDGDRLLLVRRANPPAQGTWSIPGGRVEPGESDKAAVLRELLEETGIAGTVEREVGTVRRDAPAGGTYVIRDFLVRATSRELTAGDDAADAGWFTPAQVRTLPTSPGLVATLSQWGLLSG